MKSKLSLLLVCIVLASGCGRYERAEEPVTMPAPVVVARDQEEDGREQNTNKVVDKEIHIVTDPIVTQPQRTPIKVKGIYISAYVAGTQNLMDEIIQHIDETEINAVVIDVKDDNGRITFSMDSPVVSEIGAVKRFIPDIEGLMKKLKEHNIYTIARVVAFRDPYLPEYKPELALKLPDGSIYRDSKGLAWVNPYKQEVWDYLVEVGIEASKAGFDEVQFDYIRFSTERGVNNVVYDEADTNGRSKKDIITEFIEYAYDRLADQGVFVAADVFGAIIGGGVDSDAVGQSYGDMADHLDYICPMIYPSHYGAGYFGIDHPDTRPYDTILAALKGSKEDLGDHGTKEGRKIVVRPWLQDFTASYLDYYIEYGDEEVRQQIQAVYDAGYDEWLLWSAACRYHWGGLESSKEAKKQKSSQSPAADSLENQAGDKAA
ncbi:MAG: putative glycoside hydrolase [Hungatella sp.]|nr:putative glycoside hydrolase [Hungatella sp.]